MTRTEKIAAVLLVALSIAALPLIAVAQATEEPRVLGGPDPVVPTEGAEVTATAEAPVPVELGAVAEPPIPVPPETLVAVKAKDTQGIMEAIVAILTVLLPWLLVRFTSIEDMSPKTKQILGSLAAIVPPLVAMFISANLTPAEAGTIAVGGAGVTNGIHNYLRQYAPAVAGKLP